MNYIKVAFLIATLAMVSGYKFRCWAFCTDQTSTQHDYIEQRDKCRNYAQLKLDMSLRNTPGYIDGKTKKGQLVSLFSECMANNGWTVPDGKAPGAPGGPATLQNAAVPATPAQATDDALADAYREKASLSRSSECAFARHAALNSSIAAARARACDAECAQRLSAAPDAPRPAACAADVDPDSDLIRGRERDE